MKKRVFAIIIILIFILAVAFICKANFYSKIDDGIGISKQEINVFNRKFYNFYGINSSKDIRIFLQQCIDHYCIYAEEFAKIPFIKFLSDNEEIVLEYDDSQLYGEKTEREYYIGLQNILENITDEKSYKVEFKYSTKIVDGVSLIREIDITECDEEPKKFDIQELEKNPVYIDYYIENNDPQKVNIEVKEDSISKSGVTIIVTDENRVGYTWGDEYSIEQKVKNKWKKLKVKKDKKDEITCFVAHKVDENNQITFNIDWTLSYGELPNGTYRIVKPVSKSVEFYSNEFEIID